MTFSKAFFDQIDEPFASGFYEHPEKGRFFRFSNAFRRFLESCPLPRYTGGRLYPEGLKFGDASFAVTPDYSSTVHIEGGTLRKKGLTDEQASQLSREMPGIDRPSTPHTVGGYCFTHSLPNYRRIEHEGLDSYETRIRALEPSEFREGLLTVMAGIRARHSRILEYLANAGAVPELTEALRQVPFRPARTLYEAVVCRNYVFYLDFCDNPGRLDEDWEDFYRGENIEPLLEAFFRNVDINNGWSSSVGPRYSPLTEQVLHAIRGKRRPQIELRVTPDMPDEIWKAAIESVKSGNGHPSFYNEPLYQRKLRETFPEASEQDLLQFNGGGCTETMFEGITRAGSNDAGINTALVFSETMRSCLGRCETFDEFFDLYINKLREAVDDTLEKVDNVYRQREELCPQPMRTLLIDDCIDNARDFNAGGARLNYSVINFAGLVNTADSLSAVRELVFRRKEYSAETLIAALDANDPVLYARLRELPHYGNDEDEADSLASDFVQTAFSMLDGKKVGFGSRCLSSSIQFITYTGAGRNIPATPDGRTAGAPLCDSLGALEGKAVKGPTAMLTSVCKLPLSKAIGTPVLNFRIAKSHADSALKPLIRSFFDMGGMQIQINCVSREDMEDALCHPERHEDLVVRVGGYSEYFNRLEDDLKKTLIERREF